MRVVQPCCTAVIVPCARRRGHHHRRSALCTPLQSSRDPPASVTSSQPPLSPTAQQLAYLLEQQTHLFPSAAEQHLAALAESLAAAAPVSTVSLEDRIGALRAREACTAEVAHVLALQVQHRLACTLLTEVQIGDEPPLPGRAAAERLSDLLHNESGAVPALHEMQAHVEAIMPGSAPNSTVCRLDAVSGGRLYAGSVQFGYFLRSVFSATQRLQEPQLRVLAQSTRSNEAWEAVRNRAAALWRLEDRHAADEFSTGVTLAPSAASSEFYSADGEAGTDAGGPNQLQSASTLLPLRPSSLRDLIAEAMLWGWHLRGCEAALEGDAKLATLLTPRMALD